VALCLFAVSPRERRGREYPAILFMTADYGYESPIPCTRRKMAAEMQDEAKNGSKPDFGRFWLRIESKAGHGAGNR